MGDKKNLIGKYPGKTKNTKVNELCSDDPNYLLLLKKFQVTAFVKYMK
jgi:hypothetical protein